MTANAATGVPVTENQISSRPALGLGSAKRVKGTRQRCSGFDSIDRLNGLARFRTFVTRFVIIDTGRFTGIVLGTPHWIIAMTRSFSRNLPTGAWRRGQMYGLA